MAVKEMDVMAAPFEFIGSKVSVVSVTAVTVRVTVELVTLPAELLTITSTE